MDDEKNTKSSDLSPKSESPTNWLIEYGKPKMAGGREMDELEIEDHVAMGRSILDQIGDMPTWQFGALMTSIISCWFLAKVPPEQRGDFLATLLKSLSKRFPEAVSAVEVPSERTLQ